MAFNSQPATRWEHIDQYFSENPFQDGFDLHPCEDGSVLSNDDSVLIAFAQSGVVHGSLGWIIPRVTSVDARKRLSDELLAVIVVDEPGSVPRRRPLENVALRRVPEDVYARSTNAA